MELNTINLIERWYRFASSKERLLHQGLKYHLIGCYPKDRKELVWSERMPAYLLDKGKTSSCLVDFISCDPSYCYEKIFVRKNQFIIIGEGLIIKQLFNGASVIGLRAEKQQRVKLQSQGIRITPDLYEVDVDNGCLIEEYVDGKLLSDCELSDEEIIEHGFGVYKELISAGKVRDIRLSVLYSYYQKKLIRMAVRFKDSKASQFINLKLKDIDDYVNQQDGDSLIRFTDMIHGDFNPRNNLLVDKLGRVRVIDWEHSASGPILFDYLYMLVHMKLEPMWMVNLLRQTSPDILDSKESVGAHIRVCFLLLIIIKLNLWEYKDGLRKKALSKRLAMLENVYSILRRNF